MSARRHNLCLVDTRSDTSNDGYDPVHETGVMRRPPRESYTHEKELSAGSAALRPSLAADLLEPGSQDDELLSVHLRPTLRPAG